MNGDGRRRPAEARWIYGISAAMVAAGVALVARGSSPPPSTSLPRFEPHGRDVGVALGIEEGPSNEEVAAEVKRNGFYAGAPVGAGDCVGCHRLLAVRAGGRTDVGRLVVVPEVRQLLVRVGREGAGREADLDQRAHARPDDRV